MNLQAITIFLLLLFLLPIILFYLGHPILWLLYILVWILLLPTILFHHEILCRIPPYLDKKVGQYEYFKKATTDILSRHFGIQIKGQEIYDKPVIFIVNHHEPGSYLDHFCLMTIKTREKIVMYKRRGMVGKLFRNLECITLEKEETNRLPIFLEKCKYELYQGISVIIYPEGKYASEKTNFRPLKQFQKGAFILACTYGVPIVPICISGGNYKNGLVTRKPIKIEYLPSVDPKGYKVEELSEKCLKEMNKVLNRM